LGVEIRTIESTAKNEPALTNVYTAKRAYSSGREMAGGEGRVK